MEKGPVGPERRNRGQEEGRKEGRLQVSKARSYKSPVAEANVVMDTDDRGRTVYCPDVAMVIAPGDLPLTKAKFKQELLRLKKWIDLTLLWLEKQS